MRSHFAHFVFCLAALGAFGQLLEGRTIVVTGATGSTGSMVYLSLKGTAGVVVRALVRNASKARDVLHCDKCDDSEGIFEGDVTQPATLNTVMVDADSLVITTGPAYHCLVPGAYIGCKYYPGADPKTMSWLGVKNQVFAFANSSGPALADKHVVLISNDLTTVPDNFLDKIDNGWGCFYALNGEAFTLSSGVPSTIIKPNGLGDGAAGEKAIVVAHDDAGECARELRMKGLRTRVGACAFAFALCVVRACMHVVRTIRSRIGCLPWAAWGAVLHRSTAVLHCNTLHGVAGWSPTDLNYEFISRADVARLVTYLPHVARCGVACYHGVFCTSYMRCILQDAPTSPCAPGGVCCMVQVHLATRSMVNFARCV